MRKWVTMAHLLGAEAVHLEFPTKVVFDSVTIGINEGTGSVSWGAMGMESPRC